jgi:hypothetical protein
MLMTCAGLISIFPGCDRGEDEAGLSGDSKATPLEYRDGAYLWRPSRIGLFVEEGSAIRLEQELNEGEFGWKMSRLDIPSSWEIKNLRFEGLALCFNNQHGESFSVQPPTLNKLNFQLLDGGDKPDSRIADIWREHALTKK